MMIAVICVTIIGLMVFGLGLLVSLRRGKPGGEMILFGIGNDPASPLAKASRAHVNVCEYGPLMAIMMLYLGSAYPRPWVFGIIVFAVVARIVQAIGFLTCESLVKLYSVKIAGALLNYLSGALLCVAMAASVM